MIQDLNSVCKCATGLCTKVKTKQFENILEHLRIMSYTYDKKWAITSTKHEHRCCGNVEMRFLHTYRGRQKY